ncbi:MAG: hypothetical protein HOQ24_18055 [Mycobacteriaceae bacterium]|nr:hypothetical protein [Mycobacteriaceae bacterium]
MRLMFAAMAAIVPVTVMLGAAHANAAGYGEVSCTTSAVDSRAEAVCVNPGERSATVALTGVCSNMRPFYQADVRVAAHATVTLTEDCGPDEHPLYQYAWGAVGDGPALPRLR